MTYSFLFSFFSNVLQGYKRIEREGMVTRTPISVSIRSYSAQNANGTRKRKNGDLPRSPRSPLRRVRVIRPRRVVSAIYLIMRPPITGWAKGEAVDLARRAPVYVPNDHCVLLADERNSLPFYGADLTISRRLYIFTARAINTDCRVFFLVFVSIFRGIAVSFYSIKNASRSF